MIREARAQLRLLWRGLALPVALLLAVLLAASNVANAASAIPGNLELLLHTKAEYASNGMSFADDLAKPARVTNKGGDTSVSNLARYDYDALSRSITAIRAGSTLDEALGFSGFIVFPVLFFLLGLWASTVQRRTRTEKFGLVRAGPTVLVAARQLALLVACALIVVAVLAVDAAGRAIARVVVSTTVALDAYPPIDPTPESIWQGPAAQLALVLLVAVFFGGAGIAIGSITGGFAIPALAFLVWDLVVPVLGPHDPRNWLAVLGHQVFSYSSAFQLVQPQPIPSVLAAVATVVTSLGLVVLGYVGMRLRNPLAT